MLIVHELAHAFHDGVPFVFPRSRLMELFANMALYAECGGPTGCLGLPIHARRPARDRRPGPAAPDHHAPGSAGHPQIAPRPGPGQTVTLLVTESDGLKAELNHGQAPVARAAIPLLPPGHGQGFCLRSPSRPRRQACPDVRPAHARTSARLPGAGSARRLVRRQPAADTIRGQRKVPRDPPHDGPSGRVFPGAAGVFRAADGCNRHATRSKPGGTGAGP